MSKNMNSQIYCREILINKTIKGLLLFLTLIMLAGCEVPNPIEKFRAELTRYPEYSVILSDMKEEGDLSSSYFHKYTIVTGVMKREQGKDIKTPSEPSSNTKPDTKTETKPNTKPAEELTYETKNTDWMRVPQKVYKQYENYLGMTILSKDAKGTISDTAYPAGYQYVGDSRYGQWKNDSSGHSFWEFYGKYMFMSSIFHMIGNRVNRNDYDNYKTNNSLRKPYFGTNNDYGTNGARTKAAHSSFFERRQERIQMKQENFSRKVSNRTGRTSYRSSSGFRGGRRR
ncbi:MAG: hypothetical protein HQK93_01870 [Nitrospirae bacterium]|nr:hypothetical protein [Nitrospirota bacterium]